VRKTFGELLACVPGHEPAAIEGITKHAPDLDEALRGENAVVLVGERAASVPGLFSALHDLVERTGVRLAWIPRRAGDRGGLETGCVPGLLPGGRRVGDDAARVAVENAWGVPIPAAPGRDATEILKAASGRELGGLVVGGVDPFDLPDPDLALRALDNAGFVVSLELRHSAVTERADVVLPVAASDEKAGSYLSWEGRTRSFDITIEGTGSMPDCRVLDTLAVEMDTDLYTQTPAAARGDYQKLGPASALRWGHVAAEGAASTQAPGAGQAVLSTWRQLIDNGSLQDGEPHLKGTQRKAVARLSAKTAEGLGATVKVSTERGAITLPIEVADLPDGVVWLPGNSDGSAVAKTLGAGHGAVVNLAGGEQ
jgi:NADH-quinone oxidoreductase subunit G